MSTNSSKIEVLSWTLTSWTDYLYWQKQDKKTFRRINRLVGDALLSPYQGLGKPEPLKHSLAGFWSRRIDRTNRLVYAVDKNRLTIISCRYHY